MRLNHSTPATTPGYDLVEKRAVAGQFPVPPPGPEHVAGHFPPPLLLAAGESEIAVGELHFLRIEQAAPRAASSWPTMSNAMSMLAALPT